MRRSRRSGSGDDQSAREGLAEGDLLLLAFEDASFSNQLKIMRPAVALRQPIDALTAEFFGQIAMAVAGESCQLHEGKSGLLFFGVHLREATSPLFGNLRG